MSELSSRPWRWFCVFCALRERRCFCSHHGHILADKGTWPFPAHKTGHGPVVQPSTGQDVFDMNPASISDQRVATKVARRIAPWIAPRCRA